MGIALKREPGTVFSVQSHNDLNESYKLEERVPDGGRLVIILDNDCHNTTDINDIQYYYNDGSQHHGIVVKPASEPAGGKVACNARRVTAVAGGKRLYDVV